MPDFSYTVCRSKRRRRTVALLVEPGGAVRVMAPAGLSLRKIERFVEERAPWVWQRLHVLRHCADRKPVCDFSEGSAVYYLGESYRLQIEAGGAGTGCSIEGGAMAVRLPEGGLPVEAQRAEVQLELSLWYKKQARREFQQRLVLWAERLGVRFQRLVVTNPSKRWGSCNVRGDIRLNWRLIMVPSDLLDYVVVHELCHIRHRNHAKGFWAFVGSVMPDYKERRQRLRAWEAADPWAGG